MDVLPIHHPLASGLIGVARGARARYHGGEKIGGIIYIGVSCKCTPGRARSRNFVRKFLLGVVNLAVLACVFENDN